LFTAVVRVTGAGRLADFRERLRFLMVRDADAEDYSEHHAEGVLEYRFEPKTGIPFPALAETSGEFPELRVEAAWDHDGVRGRAVIENGRVLEETRAQPDSPGVEVSVGEDGRLLLGFVLKENEREWLGYAVTSDRHTYFRYREGALTLVDPTQPDSALEETAFGFVEEWIWYDEEQAPVERARYVDYGYAVCGANVRSEKLALLRANGMRYSSLDEAARPVREALAAAWLNRS
jgi:hypothetical protein